MWERKPIVLPDFKIKACTELMQLFLLYWDVILISLRFIWINYMYLVIVS